MFKNYLLLWLVMKLFMRSYLRKIGWLIGVRVHFFHDWLCSFHINYKFILSSLGFALALLHRYLSCGVSWNQHRRFRALLKVVDALPRVPSPRKMGWQHTLIIWGDSRWSNILLSRHPFTQVLVCDKLIQKNHFLLVQHLIGR